MRDCIWIKLKIQPPKQFLIKTVVLRKRIKAVTISFSFSFKFQLKFNKEHGILYTFVIDVGTIENDRFFSIQLLISLLVA